MRASVRATPDAGEGTFEALVSSYAETYDIGWGWSERILPGCFAASITEHPSIPICWNHEWRAGPIGDGVAQELDLGLIVRGELYLDLDPMVQRVYRSMRAGAVDEWSIAFFPERISNDEAEPYCDLIERGDLIEATACFRGANPGTETLDLRGGPVVTVDGDAEAEVVRLRKLFSVPEIRGGGARRTAGDPAGEVPPSDDEVVDHEIVEDDVALEAGAETPGELPGESGAGEAAAVAAPELLGRALATRAGRDAMRLLVRSASACSPSAGNGTTP